VDAFGQTYRPDRSKKTGAAYGLRLDLLFELLPSDPSQNLDVLQEGVGVSLTINNQSNMPLSTERVEVRPGASTHIVLHKSVTTTLPAPYGSCINMTGNNHSVIPALFINNGYAYRRLNCLEQCNQMYMIERCQCADIDMVNMGGAKLCLTQVEQKCMATVNNELDKKAYAPGCSQMSVCPLECEITVYSHSQYQNTFPSPAYASYLATKSGVQNIFAMNNMSYSYEKLQQSVVSVAVFFDDLHYELVSDAPSMELPDLVSGIGGMWGLFLGMSVLSVIEYVEIVIELLYIVWRRRFCKSENSTGEKKSSTLVMPFEQG
jgi:hypothetical protein